MGLTTQVSNTIQIGRNQVRLNFKRERYTIAFVNRDENINFDEKMQTLKGEFAELLKSEGQSKKDLLEVFITLGYEL